MNTELMGALELLEKEKDISKDTLLEAIEQSLIPGLQESLWKGGQRQGQTLTRKPAISSVYAARNSGGDGSTDPVIGDFPGGRAGRSAPGQKLGDAIRVADYGLQRIWPNRHPECQKCDPAEDPRGGA